MTAVSLPEDYWYLGSPYTKYPLGLQAAWIEVCREAALLTKAGIPVFSPIAHSHPLAFYGNLDPLNVPLWIRADHPLLIKAKGLIVLEMNGWWESTGLTHEINVFTSLRRPIIHMTPGIVPTELDFASCATSY